MRRYDVYLVDVSVGLRRDLSTARPCVVISPEEMNDNINTVIVVPVTTEALEYPTRIPVHLQGRDGWMVLDEIQTVDKERLFRRFGRIDEKAIRQARRILMEMLVE
jgi:mRNA interferase MazF